MENASRVVSAVIAIEITKFLLKMGIWRIYTAVCPFLF